MSTKLYLGHLPRCDERDIEDFLKGYGRLVDVKVMTGFGFVEFDDPRDAKDAVNDLNGKTLLGERISVEYSRSSRDRRGGDDYDRRGGGYDDRRFERREPRFPRPRRTGFRAIVEGLSPSVSWQDLKDFARTAGEVTFADCHKEKEGTGAVEYEIEDDLKNAVEKLDGQELKGSVVTVRADPDATVPADEGRPFGGSRDARSRSPYRRPPPRRSPSPYARRERRRSPSPYGRRRSPSPYARRRSPSPYARRGAPADDRSPPPRRRDDY